MNKRIYILFIIVLLSNAVFAQFIGKDDISISLFYFQKTELDSAKKYIDKAILDDQLNTTTRAWYYRGIIYKDLYKKRDKTNKQSLLRLESIKSFKKVIQLNLEKESIESSKKSMNYLASTLYNDAARMLNIANYEGAQENYLRYRETMLIVDPSMDLSSQDITFKMALASMLNGSKEEVSDSNQLHKVKSILLDVLSIDPENPEANFNLATLYYNAGANIINSLDYDIDLLTLYKAQDACAKLFLKALPYMKKSYQLNYKRKETLIGLSNIYYGLNDEKKFDAYKKELQDLENDK